MRKYMSLLLAVALAVSAIGYGATRSSQLNDQFVLDRAQPGAMQQTKLGTKVTFGRVHEMRAYWDFADQGGAVSTITLKSVDSKQPAVLPSGAIVTNCIFDVITVPSPSPYPSGSPAPTLAFSTGQGAGDLKTAAAPSGYTGIVACIPVGTAATAIKLTADQTMTMAIGGQAELAGKVYVLVQYILSNGT